MSTSNPIAKKSSIGWRPDIDGLRALAVFAVFVFHAFPKVPVFKGGFIGVDVFFVISGFLISSIIYTQLAKGTFSFWDFYSRRIRRIYPVLLTVLIACLGFGWFYLLADEYMQLGKHIAGGAGFVSNFVLFFEKGYFDNASATKPLLHLWSLGIEEQFYIFWPLILWLTWKLKKNAVFWVALAIAVISMGMNLYWYNTNPSMDFFLPHTRVWELLCGAMLAWGNLHWKEKIVEKVKNMRGGDILPNTLSVAGFSLLIICIIFMQEKGFPGWQAILPIASTVLIIMAGKEAVLNKYILSNKILVWFGLISYPMYLWHWPLISMKRIVSLEAPKPLYCVGAFVACTILAWLTTKLIENPLRFGEHGKVKTIGLFLVMMALGGTGYAIYAKKGLPKRFPKEIQTLERILLGNHRTNQGFFLEDGNLNPCRSHDWLFNLKECKKFENLDPNKKTIAIWGDSHAAHLVPGFWKYYKNNFNIMQRTGTRIVGIIKNVKNDIYQKNNQIILKDIINEKPWVVILSNRWSNYKSKLPFLKSTVQKLRSAGINNIVIIGDSPNWRSELPKELARFWIKKGKFPARLKRLDEKREDYKLDKYLSSYSKELGVQYISLMEVLCNKDGCLTMTDNNPDNILYFDQGHLTNSGSEYVVDKIKNEFNFKNGAVLDN